MKTYQELLSEITLPKAIIKVGAVKIHLEGVTPDQEAWIVAPMTRNYDTQPEKDQAGSEYTQRLMRSCIKKVEGVLIDVDGTSCPFEVQFVDDSKKLIDLTSYVFISKLFNKMMRDKQVDFGEQIIGFYNSSLFLPDGVTFATEDEKKN